MVHIHIVLYIYIHSCTTGAANDLRSGRDAEGAGFANAPPISALLSDGILSARLFSSYSGMEMVDELLGAKKTPADAKAEQESQASANAGRGRSALLTFHRLPPWQTDFSTDFAGTTVQGGGMPFAVNWEGPWELAANPLNGSSIVKPGRLVAQLQGPIGTIRFGRAVHLQALDLARPFNAECMRYDESVGKRQKGKAKAGHRASWGGSPASRVEGPSSAPLAC